MRPKVFTPQAGGSFIDSERDLDFIVSKSQTLHGTTRIRAAQSRAYEQWNDCPIRTNAKNKRGREILTVACASGTHVNARGDERWRGIARSIIGRFEHSMRSSHASRNPMPRITECQADPLPELSISESTRDLGWPQ